MILIIGANGYIGNYLYRSFKRDGISCMGTSYKDDGSDLLRFDLCDADMSKLPLDESPDTVIIAGAVALVGRCESDPEYSRKVNVEGPVRIARQLKGSKSKLLYFSTDYVFKGDDGPYSDDDIPEPRTEYGKQKAGAEKELRALMDNCLILRLSKIYSLEKGDGTLLDETASKLAKGEAFSAAYDQRFCPAWIDDLYRGLSLMIDQDMCGTFNFCAPEKVFRYDICRELAEKMNADPFLLRSVSLHDIPGLEMRPLDTSMTCTRLDCLGDFKFKNIHEAIETVAENYR